MIKFVSEFSYLAAFSNSDGLKLNDAGVADKTGAWFILTGVDRSLARHLRGECTKHRTFPPSRIYGGTVPFLPCDCRLHVINALYFQGLPVCLSNVDCDKTKETCSHILIPHERSCILVF